MKRTVSFSGLRGFRVFGVMLGPQYFEQGFGLYSAATYWNYSKEPQNSIGNSLGPFKQPESRNPDLSLGSSSYLHELVWGPKV